MDGVRLKSPSQCTRLSAWVCRPSHRQRYHLPASSSGTARHLLPCGKRLFTMSSPHHHDILTNGLKRSIFLILFEKNRCFLKKKWRFFLERKKTAVGHISFAASNENKEVWVSGRNQHTANVPSPSRVPKVQILLLPLKGNLQERRSWRVVADCKSVALGLSRFESYLLHKSNGGLAEFGWLRRSWKPEAPEMGFRGCPWLPMSRFGKVHASMTMRSLLHRFKSLNLLKRMELWLTWCMRRTENP